MIDIESARRGVSAGWAEFLFMHGKQIWDWLMSLPFWGFMVVWVGGIMFFAWLFDDDDD